jgi:hypothetical protein
VVGGDAVVGGGAVVEVVGSGAAVEVGVGDCVVPLVGDPGPELESVVGGD